MAKRAIRNYSDPAEIYDSFLSSCCPASFPEPWTGLDACDCCYHCPPDSEDTFEQLIEEYRRDHLLASGLAIAEGGALMLDESLRDPQGFVVAIREAPDKPAHDLLTSSGCISGAIWPVIAAFRDFRIQELLADYEHRLLVAFEMVDVVLLRCLGIPATLGVGLETFDVELLDELADRFGWDVKERQVYLGNVDVDHEAEALALEERLRPSSPVDEARDDVEARCAENDDREECDVEADEIPESGCAAEEQQHSHRQGQEPKECVGRSESSTGDKLESEQNVAVAAPTLVVLGWSPSRLDLESPLEVDSFAKYLDDARWHLGINASDDVDRWVPNRANLENIRKCLEYGVMSTLR